jgi:hypothetical protein
MRRALIRKPTAKKPQIVRERKLYGNARINYKRNIRNGKIIGTKQILADEGGKEIDRKHRKITKAKHIPTQRKKQIKIQQIRTQGKRMEKIMIRREVDVPKWPLSCINCWWWCLAVAP